MRNRYFANVFLAVLLTATPLYAADLCDDCISDESDKNLQNTPVCDTYITDSASNRTLQSIEHRITEQVKQLFANESDLPDITVTTANGVVFLSGDAKSQAQIDKAAGLAATVPCVTDVDTSKLYIK